MFAGSLVLALAVFGFTGWLHYYESRGWPEEEGSELDVQYRSRRYRARSRIHAMLFLCGVLITVAAFYGPGRVWIGCWMVVALILMSVIALAMGDAWRTHRYLKSKIPEMRKRMLDGE